MANGAGWIKFDWTVTFGHILIVGGMISTGVSIYTATAITMSNHELRLVVIEREMQSQAAQNSILIGTLSDVRRDVAVMKDRLERGK